MLLPRSNLNRLVALFTLVVLTIILAPAQITILATDSSDLSGQATDFIDKWEIPRAFILQVGAGDNVCAWVSEETSPDKLPAKLESIALAAAATKLANYKAEQAKAKSPDVVIVGGTDQATCGLFLQALDTCERASISYIIVDTAWHKANSAYGHQTDCQGILLASFPQPDAIITITAEHLVLWNNTLLPLDTLIKRLATYQQKLNPGEHRMAIHVANSAVYPTLRYILGEVQKCGIKSVDIRKD